VHIKVCLAREYIPRVRGQVKMAFNPVIRKVNYTEARGYNPISLLSFMQKTMQQLVARNIKDETLRHFPYI